MASFASSTHPHTLFVYGTLKKGFGNFFYVLANKDANAFDDATGEPR